MKIIWYVEVVCDQCGRSLRSLAGDSPQDRFQLRRLFRLLEAMGARHGWLMERTGDLCSRCLFAEQIKSR